MDAGPVPVLLIKDEDDERVPKIQLMKVDLHPANLNFSSFRLSMLQTAPTEIWNWSPSSRCDRPRSFSLIRFIFSSRQHSPRDAIYNKLSATNKD